MHEVRALTQGTYVINFLMRYFLTTELIKQIDMLNARGQADLNIRIAMLQWAQDNDTPSHIGQRLCTIRVLKERGFEVFLAFGEGPQVGFKMQQIIKTAKTVEVGHSNFWIFPRSYIYIYGIFQF